MSVVAMTLTPIIHALLIARFMFDGVIKSKRAFKETTGNVTVKTKRFLCVV